MIGDILSHINYLAVIIASLAYFFVGAVWYSKALFASQWVALNGIDVNAADARKGLVQMMLSTFLMNVVIALALSVLIQAMGLHGAMHGFKLGLLCSVAFSTMTISMGYVYQRKPMMLYVIDCGYHIVGIILASVILSVMM
jgi:hypothetical protein